MAINRPFLYVSTFIKNKLIRAEVQNVQLLKGHQKKVKGKKWGSKVLIGSILHIKRKKCLHWSVDKQSEMLTVQPLAVIMWQYMNVYTYMDTETQYSILIEYPGVLQEILEGKWGEKRSCGVSRAFGNTERVHHGSNAADGRDHKRSQSKGSINPTECLVLQRSTAYPIYGMLPHS